MLFAETSLQQKGKKLKAISIIVFPRVLQRNRDNKLTLPDTKIQSNENLKA